MGAFYADRGPLVGPLLFQDAPEAIGVWESPDAPTPLATAIRFGPNPDGVAVWRIVLDDVELSGSWLVIDREFRLIL